MLRIDFALVQDQVRISNGDIDAKWSKTPAWFLKGYLNQGGASGFEKCSLGVIGRELEE